MARNEEKANSMLNRWLRGKREEEGRGAPVKAKRPRLVAKCNSLSECQGYRMDLIREIADSIAAIQNTTLPEPQVRQLNDEINKLLREKGRWERHIKSLGGPDYMRMAEKIRDADGSSAVGSGGYQYFGVAKELPGVRELLQQQQQSTGDSGESGDSGRGVKRTRHDLYQGLDAEYYGYGFDEDGDVAALEAQVESALLTEAQRKWDSQHAANGGSSGSTTVPAAGSAGASSFGVESAAAAAAAAAAVAEAANAAAAAAPSPADMEKALLAARKAKALSKLPKHIRETIKT